jgi:hypothetical protein
MRFEASKRTPKREQEAWTTTDENQHDDGKRAYNNRMLRKLIVIAKRIKAGREDYCSLSTEDGEAASLLIPTASFCDAWPEIILFMMKGLFKILPENEGGGGDRGGPLLLRQPHTTIRQ